MPQTPDTPPQLLVRPCYRRTDHDSSQHAAAAAAALISPRLACMYTRPPLSPKSTSTQWAESLTVLLSHGPSILPMAPFLRVVLEVPLPSSHCMHDSTYSPAPPL